MDFLLQRRLALKNHKSLRINPRGPCLRYAPGAHGSLLQKKNIFYNFYILNILNKFIFTYIFIKLKSCRSQLKKRDVGSVRYLEICVAFDLR